MAKAEKNHAEPIEGTEVIIEQPNESRKIISLKYESEETITCRVIDIEISRSIKGYRYYPVNNEGIIYKNPYLSWCFAFDRNGKFPKDAERNIGLRSVKEGRRLAYPGNYSSDDIGMDDSAEHIVKRLKKFYETDDVKMLHRIDDFGDDDYSISVVVYREGTLADYFDLEEIIYTYEINGHILSAFREDLSTYFSTPISELAKQHLFGNRQDAVNELETSDEFSFNLLHCSELQRIIRGLLLGHPVEVTAYELHGKRG